jgi:hypothetical protein
MAKSLINGYALIIVASYAGAPEDIFAILKSAVYALENLLPRGRLWE